MLRRLLADHRPAHAAVVFDAPGRTFREDLFEAYKANREPMPEELSSQVQPIHAVVRALGLPLLLEPGVEADDVIGALARRPRPRVRRAHLDRRQGPRPARERAGHAGQHHGQHPSRPGGRGGQVRRAPERIVDWLALVGDTVDNIPGVPKVGPKTAAKWLGEYGSLDGVIAHADAIAARSARTSGRASPATSVPRAGDHPPRRAARSRPRRPHPVAPDTDRLRQLYTELEFRSWLAELLAPGQDSPAPRASRPPRPGVRGRARPGDLRALARVLAGRRPLRLRHRDHSLDYIRAEIVASRSRWSLAPPPTCHSPTTIRAPGPALPRLGPRAAAPAARGLRTGEGRPQSEIRT